MNTLKTLSLMAAAAGFMVSAFAQEGEGTAEETYEEYAASILSELDAQQGVIPLAGSPVTLTVPETLDFYGPADTKRIAEGLWGNPPSDDRLGMLFPAGGSPADFEVWGIILTYDPSGYVSDTDARSTDYGALLEALQEGTRAANAEREAMGYGAVELVGWAAEPRYDGDNHRLYWAKDLVFSSSEAGVHTLNYDMRFLGRRGVLSMNFVADMEDLDAILAAAPSVLDVPQFNAGEAYTDYRTGDAQAGYGLAALIAGGTGAAVAKKTGLLAVLLVFLKKGWILVFAVLAAIGGALKRAFGGQ